MAMATTCSPHRNSVLHHLLQYEKFSIMVQSDESDRRALLEDDRTFVPAYLGPSRWVGLDLDADTDWTEVAELLDASYRLTAPARDVAELDARSCSAARSAASTTKPWVRGSALQAPDRFRSGGSSLVGWSGGVDRAVGQPEGEFPIWCKFDHPAVVVDLGVVLQTGMRLSRSVVPPCVHQMMWWSLQRS